MKTEAAKLLSEARVEAGDIVSRTRSDAARFADEMKVKARADADALVKHAERQIDMQTDARDGEHPPRSGRSVGRDRVEDPAA